MGDEVDFKTVDKLCKIHCTASEIAAFFGKDAQSYAAFFKEKTGIAFHEYIRLKTESIANPSLRRMQLLAAKRGSVPMLIWLGKQYLNQIDKKEVATTNEHKGVMVVPGIASVEDWQNVAVDQQAALMQDDDE